MVNDVKRVGTGPGVRVELEKGRLAFEITDPVKIEEFKRMMRRALANKEFSPEWAVDVLDVLDDVPPPFTRPDHAKPSEVP